MGTHSFPDLVKGEQVIEVDAVLADLRQRNEKVLFLGDGAVLNRIMIEDVLDDAAYFPAAKHHRIEASAVGLIGKRMFMRGDTRDFVTFTPHYLRLSEAETKSGGTASLVDKDS
jgi:tRNA threonylcarbamoyladenosine biosynthesis protein TsaB